MSLEYVFFASCLLLSVVGLYLNLAYQRATHRSTVYARFSGKNLRFLSIAHIILACSNIVAIAAMWASPVNRSKQSESFFSTTLSITRALPQLTIFWVTVERIMFKISPTIRENAKFRHTAIFRIIQVVVSIIIEMILRGVYMNSEDQTKISNMTSENSSDDVIIKNSLVSNYLYDYYHGAFFIPCLVISILMFNSARSSHTRANLLGGMRNDQKIQNLSSQMKFFTRSYIPLFIGCLADYLLQLVIKRGLVLEESLIDLIYINARCFLPISFPLSLIALNKNLRADYFANFILCRKARNLHKESKVKVIATRESQESIIANLKMIGILSDVDTTQGASSAAGLAMMGMGGGEVARPASSVAQRVPIAKDPTSVSSVTSGTRGSSVSLSGGGSVMMFTTRPKNSVPSMGSVG
uniref:G protein-coupled receptor n=2 Tax=Caenorhabditis tropicalis TaxID=1561998 RepID=A0A1I7UFM9_9PELO